MKIKYTIKSIETRKEISEEKLRVSWCSISQNVDTIIEWISKLGLTIEKTRINSEDKEWELVLSGLKEKHKQFQTKLFTEGAKIYNISYHRLSLFD